MGLSNGRLPCLRPQGQSDVGARHPRRRDASANVARANVRLHIAAAWVAGYYDAGYTNDSAYADAQSDKYADEAMGLVFTADQQHREPLTDEQTKALQDVIAERKRQIAVECWTPEHDDEHAGGDLAEAAACYVLGTADKDTWPWEWEAWKPKDRRRNLVKAAALLLAEIERLDRRSAE